MERYSRVLSNPKSNFRSISFRGISSNDRRTDVGNSRHLHTRPDIHPSLSSVPLAHVRKDRHRLTSIPRRIFNIDNNLVPS